MSGNSWRGRVQGRKKRAAQLVAGFIGFVCPVGVALAQVSLAVGLSSPGPAAIDPTGGYLYFGQQSQTTCAAEIDRMPADSSNAAWATVVSGFGYRDGYGDCRGVGRIAFSGSKVVVDEGGYDSESIVVANRDGSGSQVLVSGNYGGNLIGIIHGVAYYMSGFYNIVEVPVAGGQAVVDPSNWFVRSAIVDAQDGAGGAIYFVDYYTNGLYRFDAASKTSQEMIAGASQEGVALEDANSIYLYLPNEIVKDTKGNSCNVATTCTVIWPTSTQSGNVSSAVLGNGVIFFSDGANVWRLYTTGGGATEIYSGANTHMEAVDNSWVYFKDGAKLFRLATNAVGGAPTLLSASVDMADDAALHHGLYWTSEAGYVNGAGSASMIVEQVSQLDSLQYASTAATLEAPCACLATIYAQLARTILRTQQDPFFSELGHYLGASANIAIDEFFQVSNPASPCSKTGGKGAVWSGNGTWINPVYGAVQGLTVTSPIGTTDLTAPLANGPVLLQGATTSSTGVSESHWILATEQASVQYASGKLTGIVAYDPLSGSKILLTGGAGSYTVKLILDPVTSAWCDFSVSCAGKNSGTLVSHINTPTMNPAFKLSDLTSIKGFRPNHFRAITISP